GAKIFFSPFVNKQRSPVSCGRGAHVHSNSDDPQCWRRGFGARVRGSFPGALSVHLSIGVQRDGQPSRRRGCSPEYFRETDRARTSVRVDEKSESVSVSRCCQSGLECSANAEAATAYRWR